MAKQTGDTSRSTLAVRRDRRQRRLRRTGPRRGRSWRGRVL